ncbi:HipA family kinase [Nannocystis pusilla]|uniref:HipA family kinase n=1 Tax=Nannocystis pusilla TaxID=889268 RepID=UPI003DA1FFA9
MSKLHDLHPISPAGNAAEGSTPQGTVQVSAEPHLQIALPPRWTCVEVRSVLPGGSSQPLLAIVEDGEHNAHRIVLKLRQPEMKSRGDHNFEGTSLACELVCSILARALGIEVPDYGIVELDQQVIEEVRERRLAEVLKRNIGPQFGCLFLDGAAEGPPARADSTEMNDALEDVAVFDASVINGDRQERKPNLLRWKGKVVAIDHALAVPVHQLPLLEEGHPYFFEPSNIREHCSYTPLRLQKRPFSRLHTQWRSGFTDEQWVQVRNSIPSSWERNPGDLDKILAFLRDRHLRSPRVSSGLCEVMQ